MKKLIFFIFLFLGVANLASAATFGINIAKDTYQVGDQFNADLKINSEDVGINAAQATIKFSPGILEVASIDKTGSVFNFWIQDPTFDNKAGTITFVGGAASGLLGKSLQGLRIVFNAKGIGQTDLVFTDGAITASDGSGTNVLTAMNKASVTIASTTSTTTTAPQVQTIERTPITSDTNPAKPVISVPLYPDPTKWYNASSKFTASWQLPSDISGVATDLDKNPTFEPSKSAGIFSNQSFSALTDGIWYLHVRFYNNIGAGTTNHYRIAIDTVPPSNFNITLSDGASSNNATPVASYQANDQLSGIDHYYAQIDSGSQVVITSKTYTLPAQKPGKHTLKIGAQDRAGNRTESTTQFEIIPIESPKIFATSTKVFTGEGGLFINGSSLPDVSIILEVMDSKNISVYNFTTTADAKGNWAYKIDSPLKSGNYYILATSQDSKGAMSLPTRSEPINASERPILVILGINITYTGLIIILLIILIGGYIIGWYTGQMVNNQRQRKIIVSQRDVTASFNIMRRDIEKAIKSWDDGKIEEHELTQIQFLLKHVNESMQKLEKYIISGIKDIGKNSK